MTNNNGFESPEANELHNILCQCNQLKSLAKTGVGVICPTYIDALNRAAITIEKLALKPI